MAFYLGLNMAGAVSAGAYTAGVVDFLVDALDSWYALKAPVNRGVNLTMPHDVQIPVMAGASAGGMTSAVAAAALTAKHVPVRAIPSPNQPVANNRLYTAWVESIDIHKLLGTNDLAGGAAAPSFLDSTPIDQIAGDAVRVMAPYQRRPYVRDILKVVLTLTNLRGTPYSIDEGGGGDLETQVFQYADFREFFVTWKDGVPQTDWQALAETAKATGAFPVALASRNLRRKAGEYNVRKFPVPSVTENGPCNPNKSCFEDQTIQPIWGLTDDTSVTTVNVDGGVTNNSPFELARRILAQEDPPRPDGRNDRTAAGADRAMVTVAPFPTKARWDENFQPSASLSKLVGELISALVTQSRFSGEDLTLGKREDVFSRYLLAPIDRQVPPGQSALAGAALGAFGGFLARNFRDHDFQLGRRNCQQFLRQHFILPETNTVMNAALPADSASRQKLRDKYNVTANDEQSRGVDKNARWYPIIPLEGELANEVTISRPKMPASAVDEILDLGMHRAQTVLEREVTSHLGSFQEFEFDIGWRLFRGRLRDKMKNLLIAGLRKEDLLSE